MSSNHKLCQTCHMGRLTVKTTTYTQVFEGHLVALHNVPAMVCDMCGERVFDSQVLSRLACLLGISSQPSRAMHGRL